MKITNHWSLSDVGIVALMNKKKATAIKEISKHVGGGYHTALATEKREECYKMLKEEAKEARKRLPKPKPNDKRTIKREASSDEPTNSSDNDGGNNSNGQGNTEKKKKGVS